MQAVCAEIARLLDVRTTMLVASPDGPELRAAYHDFASELVARRDDTELMEAK